MNNLATKLSQHHQLKHLASTKHLMIKPLGMHAIVQEWTALAPFWALTVVQQGKDNYEVVQYVPPPVLLPIVKGLPTKLTGSLEEVAEFLIKLTTQWKAP